MVGFSELLYCYIREIPLNPTTVAATALLLALFVIPWYPICNQTPHFQTCAPHNPKHTKTLPPGQLPGPRRGFSIERNHEKGDFSMAKKTRFLCVFLLALAALLACYFLIPRPVVQDPETAAITEIIIQRNPYYQKEEADCFVWQPETEADQAVGKEILAYLSQCQERRTLRFAPAPGDHPLYWKCMYIYVRSTQQSTFLQERCIVLGPGHFEAPEDPGRYRSAVDLSFCSMGSGLWNRSQGNLLNPDGIRAFVLDALELPEDFL